MQLLKKWLKHWLKSWWLEFIGIVFILLSLAVLILWWYRFPIAVPPDNPRELIQALLQGLPVAFLTVILLINSKRHEKEIEKSNIRSLFILESEKHLQEIESWAQEMCVCTGWQDVEEIVVRQAASGLKHVYSRHLYSRHGQDYNGDAPFSFPRVGVLVGGIENPRYWKARFAKAVYQYIKRFEKLRGLEKEVREKLGDNVDNLFDYNDSFVGSLYNELIAAYPPKKGQELNECCIEILLGDAFRNPIPIQSINVEIVKPVTVISKQSPPKKDSLK